MLTKDFLLARAESMPSGCIEWSRSRNKTNYGRTWDPTTRRVILAHRAMYEAAHGVNLTPDQKVCHSCDNPPCINPDHLWLGSMRENALDNRRKERAYGRYQKLTVEDVIEIRARRAAGEPYASIARDFDISVSGTRGIVYRAYWKWVA